MLIKEFCAENYTNVPLAIKNGARRIELCDNLAVGGTTPSKGVIAETLTYAGEKNIPVMTMIRPRGGNFIYHDIELRIMETDLMEAKKLGTDGVVFGCLNKDNGLDKEALERLIEIAQGLQVTFHMAFDQIPKDRQKNAIDWLADHGVDRILSHGGDGRQMTAANRAWLKELIIYAANRITILPGGGINYKNAQEIAQILAVNEVHGSQIVVL